MLDVEDNVKRDITMTIASPDLMYTLVFIDDLSPCEKALFITNATPGPIDIVWDKVTIANENNVEYSIFTYHDIFRGSFSYTYSIYSRSGYTFIYKVIHFSIPWSEFLHLLLWLFNANYQITFFTRHKHDYDWCFILSIFRCPDCICLEICLHTGSFRLAGFLDEKVCCFVPFALLNGGLVFFCAASPIRSHTSKPNTETLQTKRVAAPLAAAPATER